MTDSTGKKTVSVLEVVLLRDKVTGPNYLDWSKTICLYLRSIRMATHLNENPPNNDSKDRWLEDDSNLFLKICNSIAHKSL